jgi:Arc/MetJ-type ribon-helix-helix transcriptional regulator
MAYDAADSGRAHRYYLIALRAAHDAGDRALAAHILADLSYQTATEGHVDEGASIGQAALDAAERSPASVRGSVMIRVSHAYAAAGRFREFERSWGEALDQTGKRDPERDPTWMYYFSVEHVRAQAGCALVQRGRWEVAEGNKGDGWRFLQRGESLLRGGAHHRPLGHANQRRALFEGAQLALACSSQGNYQDACDAIREALQRLQTVHSPRSVGVLQALAYDFRRRPRERHIRDVLPVLRASLAQHAIAHRDDAG